MLGNKSLKVLTLVVVVTLLFASLISCRPSATEEPTEAPPVEEPAEPEPVEEPEEPEEPEPEPVEETSIVIAVPEDPPSFNGAVTDTGYEQMAMELTLLGLTDFDPEGNVLTELAAELPTVENDGVVIRLASRVVDEFVENVSSAWHVAGLVNRTT